MLCQNASVSVQSSTFRSRRVHQKSRKGCIRCKQQRKKCDEVKLICSRCALRGHLCQWPEAGNAVDDVIADGGPPLSDDCSPSSSSMSGVAAQASWPRDVSTMLGSGDESLLQHYLEHTSRVIPASEEDNYALQVGIPNLASTNAPLMSSLLALAAACKCHDNITTASKTDLLLDEARNLLVTANRHHQSSLRQIQASIRDREMYDCVLANAALMVLYSFASQSVKIHLAQRARANRWQLSPDLTPTESQWIVLVRAVHTAFIGVVLEVSDQVNGPSTQVDDVADDLDQPRWNEANNGLPRPLNSSAANASAADTCSRKTVIRSCSAALVSLRSRFGTATGSRRPAYLGRYNLPALNLRDAFTALEILEDVAGTAGLVTYDVRSHTTASGVGPGLAVQTDVIAPWIREYVARVTSITPPKPLRRVIMSFLNRVSAEYLNFVEAALEMMPVWPDTYDVVGSGGLELDWPQMLALDVFAHWLVLVTLLEDVWWIGNTGEWELERVTGFMQRQGLSRELRDDSGAWWPEMIYSDRRRRSESWEDQRSWHTSLWQGGIGF